MVWRTPDSPENQAAFARTRNAQGEASYPQIRMVCQMDLTSYLLTGSAFDSVANSEMELTTRRRTLSISTAIAGKSNWATGK